MIYLRNGFLASFLDHMSIGALGDSFYEYLLKTWIQSNKEDNEGRQMFDDAMQAVLTHMLLESPSGLMYFAELKFERPEHKMDHLACFSGKYYPFFKNRNSRPFQHSLSFKRPPIFSLKKKQTKCDFYRYRRFVGFGIENIKERNVRSLHGNSKENISHLSRIV